MNKNISIVGDDARVEPFDAVAKRKLAYAKTRRERISAIRLALREGVPLHEIEARLDAADNAPPAVSPTQPEPLGPTVRAVRPLAT